MRTLLVSLAFMVMVSGCAATVPRGMENMGSVNEIIRDSANSTQIAKSDSAYWSDEIENEFFGVAMFVIDDAVLGFNRWLWWK